MSQPTILQEPPDFSLVLGGPLYQIFWRAHLSGPALELLQRRVLVISLSAWVPLGVLAAIEGHLLGRQTLTFLGDIESHVRFLVALPLLIAAELVVHRRIRPVIKLFLKRGIVTPEDTPKFYAAIDAALRARNSPWLELALLLFAYIVGHWFWRHQVALEASTWYASPDGTGIHLTLAGYWYSFVSLPIFQFIFLRWYLRLGIWFLFLWRTSRLKLRLMPAHPDRSGGIGFLGGISYAFAPVLLAQGTLLAGLIASRIFYQGQNLTSFKVSVIMLAGFFVLVILGPLTIFTPQLSRARLNGLGEYGNFATAYVTGFDEKWFQGGPKDELLGTNDIQSLADLANSYAVVSEMRLVPFTLKDMLRLALATVLPISPLLLTIMPLEELLTRFVKMIF
ncbi:MAG: hypothetical protein WA603_14255 [Candidatus Acidiferrales bacterium]